MNGDSQPNGKLEPVRSAYDASAEQYAALFLRELDRDHQSIALLSAFADLARTRRGPVVDLGCGPGGAVRHLRDVGPTVIGIDLSSGQIAQARRAFPDCDFIVGDLTSPPFGPSTLGGIVSKYSIIHLRPETLSAVFAEWQRALEPGAPLFLSYFGSRSVQGHGRPFDHKVVTAYELAPATIGDELTHAGFVNVHLEATPIPEGGRPFDHATMLASKLG